MIIHNVVEHASEGQPFFRCLLSDLHLGSRHAAHEEILFYMERAKQIGARVLVNGDVFDAIGPKDKRFALGDLHPDVQDKKDLGRAIVKMGHDLLRPYSSIIDIINIGNHEESWIKYGYSDPVRLLIDMLNRKKSGRHTVHGSFTGWINTKFVVQGTKKRPRHKLYYLHGAGGDSPVTKGTIDFNRKGRNFDYDCLTFGHKHNIVCSVEAIGSVSEAGEYRENRQLNLQTGSFYRNYEQLNDETVLDYSYAASKAHAPKPLGGLFLCLRPMRVPGKEDEWYIQQDFMSDVIVAVPVGKVKPLPSVKVEPDSVHD